MRSASRHSATSAPGRLPVERERPHIRLRDGRTLNRHNLTRRSFKPLLNRAELPQIRFHDLRHTCATLLLTRNVDPKIVSEMLGHSTIAITLDTYSHVLPNMRDQAAAAMEEALS
jgi:integrase